MVSLTSVVIWLFEEWLNTMPDQSPPTKPILVRVFSTILLSWASKRRITPVFFVRLFVEDEFSQIVAEPRLLSMDMISPFSTEANYATVARYP